MLAAPRFSLYMCLVSLSLLSSPAARPLWAAHPRIGFDEMAQCADVIFVGTVASTTSRITPTGNSIVTDVRFENIREIHRKAHVQADLSKGITLTFEGGQVGDIGLMVSDGPTFTVGQRVLLFSLFDGQMYSNPLVGGPQGLFRILRDEARDREHVVTSGGAAVGDIEQGRLKTGPRVKRIANGSVEHQPSMVREAPMPEVKGPAGVKAAKRAAPATVVPLTVDEFSDKVRAVINGPPPRNPVLPLLMRDASQVKGGTQRPQKASIASALSKPKALARTASAAPGAVDLKSGDKGESSDKGQALSVCGWQDLPIVFELLPASWWENDHCIVGMGVWNKFMDVYRMRDDDGSFGSNYYSEFCGYLTEAQKTSVYGSGWGSAIAVCRTYYIPPECGWHYETDIMFKAGLDWRPTMSESLGYSDRVLYTPVLMHELGHSWGYQTKGEEQYNYDELSVMHSSYHDIVEDGWGIHATDARLFRENYKDQTSKINIVDVGVESYYAQDGLHNATTDKTTYDAGEQITISNFTLENMSLYDTPGVRVRFYLSADRQIDQDTWGAMEGEMSWPVIPAESRVVASFTTRIPEVMTPATFYVGIIITIGGDAYNWNDDDRYNNKTSLYTPITVTCAAPSAPMGLAASDGTQAGHVRLTWNPVAGADRYEIWRGTILQSSTAQFLFSTSATSIPDSSTVAGQNYYYWLKTVRPCGTVSGFSSYDIGWEPLVAPTNLTVSNGTVVNAVRSTWNATEGASHYRVWRSTSQDPATATALSGWITTTSYDDTTAYPGQILWYWVQAATSNTGTRATSIADVVARSGYASPAVPQNLVASKGTYTDRVHLDWDLVKALYYRVYRNTVNNPATAVAIGTDWQTDHHFDDTTASPETTYFYWVKSRGLNQANSDFSLATTGWRAWSPLPSPTTVTASDGIYTNHVRVTWSSVSGALFYRLHRSTSADSNTAQPITEWLSSAIGTGYDDTTATPGVTLYYWVTAAINEYGGRASALGSGDSGWRPLRFPTGIQASNGTYTSHVHVTWNPSEGATHYRVFRNTSSNPTTAVAVTGWQTALEINDTGLDPCVSYFYWVKAAVSSDGLRETAITSQTYDAGYIAMFPPTGVTATDGEFDTMIRVTWNSVTGASYYQLFVNTVNDPATAQARGPRQTATTYDDIFAIRGVDYFYWVKASKDQAGGCETGFSASDSGWRKLLPPGNVVATDGTYDDRVRITWGAVADATHYRVYRNGVNDPNTAKPISGWQTSRTFDDLYAVPGGTYYYFVAAAADDSGRHMTGYGSDKGYRVLRAPQSVLASNGSFTDLVLINWVAPPDATHYQVYRSMWNVPGGATAISGWVTGTSFEDTTADPTAVFFYWVKAATSSGGANPSGFSNGDDGWRGLSAPTGLQASDGTMPGQVALIWNPVASATHYQVYRGTTIIALNGTAISPWQTATTFSDTTAVAGQNYYYWVKAATTSAGDFASKYSVPDTGFVGTGPMLTRAASLRQHGARGVFSLELTLDGPSAREPRTGGSTVPQMVLVFSTAIEAADGSADCNQEIVITNGNCKAVSISGQELTIDMGFNRNACVRVVVDGIRGAGRGDPLIGDNDVQVITHEGDVNGNGSVNILDLQMTKNQINQPVGQSNFRLDVNANGTINILDLQAIKNNLNQPAACP